MKVLYLITKSNWGGAQRYVFDLARGMSARHTVTVAAGGRGILAQRLAQERIAYVPITGLERDVYLLREFKAVGAIWRLLRAEQPDIIHLNSSKAGALGAFIARVYGLTHPLRQTPRIIFTAHGWAHTERRPTYQRALIAMLHWLTVALSHRTIAVSCASKREVAWMPFISRKIIVLHNGIDQTRRIPRCQARRELSERIGSPIPEHAPLIGTIAELHPNKNLPLLIKAFARTTQKHPAAHLCIIGDGQERSSLRQLVETMGITERVHIVSVPVGAARLLPALDLFALTSRKEGFPYVLLEAAYADIPIVAARVGGIPELFPAGYPALCAPRDEACFARHMIRLLEGTKRRVLSGRTVGEHVRERFTLKRMLHGTEALYRALHAPKNSRCMSSS